MPQLHRLASYSCFKGIDPLLTNIIKIHDITVTYQLSVKTFQNLSLANVSRVSTVQRPSCLHSNKTPLRCFERGCNSYCALALIERAGNPRLRDRGTVRCD